MRPINSSYDVGAARSAMSAEPIVQRLEAGDTVSYDDLDDLDDMAWFDHVLPIAVEVPGIGYRLRCSQPTILGTADGCDCPQCRED